MVETFSQLRIIPIVNVKKSFGSKYNFIYLFIFSKGSSSHHAKSRFNPGGFWLDSWWFSGAKHGDCLTCFRKCGIPWPPHDAMHNSYSDGWTHRWVHHARTSSPISASIRKITTAYIAVVKDETLDLVFLEISSRYLYGCNHRSAKSLCADVEHRRRSSSLVCSSPSMAQDSLQPTSG